jgi:uncharacterized membrane protein YphA (DoxX/SURF4 family)
VAKAASKAASARDLTDGWIIGLNDVATIADTGTRAAARSLRHKLALFANANRGDKPMKYIVTIARILLGLIFVVFGLNGFLHFLPTPQYQGIAGQFIGAIFTSHFYIVVFLTQLIGGLFMFANRYVPFGLLLLGPVLVNILSFHTFMAPAQIPLALVATVLWFIVFFQVRNAFSGVFVRRVAEKGKRIPEEVRRNSGQIRAAWPLLRG